MNETKFINEIKKSFADMAGSQERELPITWKLRGSASTAGRPDLLVVDAGETFFVETKIEKIKPYMDLFKSLTKLQRINLQSIVAAGGNAFLAIMFEGKNKRVNKYGMVLILHEMANDEMELPESIVITTKKNEQGETTFEFPKHSFLIMRNKGRWNNLEFFRGNCHG